MADNEESDDDEHRRQRIQEVLENLRKCKTKKKAMPQQKGVKAGSAAVSTTKGGRSGRHKEYKIHFGWLHYSKGSHKQVKYKQGGGTRIVTYAIDESQTVESLLSLGKKLFFPEGRSQCGLLSEMEVSLSQYDGAVLSEFTDRNGNECCFQDFLKSNGLYSSQFYLYIKTNIKGCEHETDISGNSESIISISETESVGEHASNTNIESPMITEHESQTHENETGILLVNNQVPQKILVKYTRDTISSYSGQLSSLHSQSMFGCEGFSGQPLQDGDDYSPLEDGFTVTSISVGNKLYVNKQIDGLYIFPQREELDSADVILHGPSEICGTEDDGTLIIGVVTKVHNSGEGMFTWYKSGNIFAAGIDICLVRITEPGDYNLAVEYKNVMYTFDTPVIVSRTRNDQIIGSQVATGSVNDQIIGNQVATGYVNDQIIENQVATGSVNRVATGSTNDQIIGNRVATGTVNRVATGSMNDQIIGNQVATGTVNRVATGSMNDQIIGNQVATGSVNDLIIGNQVATGTVNDQIIGNQVATGSMNDQIIGNQVATGSVNDQKIGNQVATGTVNDQIIGNQVATGSVNDQIIGNQVATGSMNDQIIGNQVATGSVNDQKIGNQVATGTVNDQIIGNQVATGSVNDQIIGNQVATGSVNDQIIGNQIATDSGIELFETLFDYETDKHVNTGAVKRGIIEPVMNIPDKKTRMSLNSTASNFREPPPVKERYNALEDNISNLHVKYEDFKILEKIGEGGFGEVYQGKYLGTNVAVKKLKVKRMKLVRQSVLQEVQINSHIRHPSIVLLMGYSMQADCLYLLTELITGPNLDDVLFGDLGREITLTHKHSIALQVCQAISYLHNRNPIIIHRDIKPENILLSKNLEIAKVCDMGLSKLKVMNTMNTTIADKRQMQPGTPAYQAPEIMLNFRTAKRPSDIWSLCCTYVELYAEKTAWNMDQGCIADDDGHSSVQIIINCMERKEIPHGLFHLETEPYISSEIIAIIREGLQYDMTKRPSALDVCKVFS